MIQTCRNCRWWNGSRDEYHHDKYGTCERIHSGGGNREPPARIYPTGSNSWLHVHRDFWCVLHEEAKK